MTYFPEIWCIKDLAKYLKYSVNYLRKLLRENPKLFPPPLPGFKRPRWDSIVVIEWFRKEPIHVRRLLGRLRNPI